MHPQVVQKLYDQSGKIKIRATRIESPLWEALDNQIRYAANCDLRKIVPKKPGVYAWYKHNTAVYVGKGRILHDRIWRRHMGQASHLSPDTHQILQYNTA